MSIIIDEEFKNLIPPLSPDEFAQLEENCTKEGIRDALIVWETPNGTKVLIDGHNRVQVAAQHGLHWNEKAMQFKSRDEAREWIIRNQFGRRNLSAYDRSILALKLKPIIAEKAKENQVRTAENRVSQKSDEQKVSTKDELAKIAGVSHDTIHKVEAIEKSNDTRLKEQIRSGDVSINQGYRIVKGIEDKHPAKAMQEFVEKKKEEHKEFKDKKTVGLDEIKADKETKRFLAMDAYTKLMRMGKQITDISLAIADGDIDLEEAAKEFTEEEQANLIMTIAKWVMQLKTITEVISA